MKLNEFDPPVVQEEKPSAKEYRLKNFGLNYEKMTEPQLKWLISLSGPANPKYKGKGETRRPGGTGIDVQKLPKKAARDEDGKIVGPGKEPQMPFSRQCPGGSEACIASAANEIVQDYFSKVKAHPPTANSPNNLRKSVNKNKLRKKWSRPQYDPVTGLWQTKRPTGTAAATGEKENWAAKVKELKHGIKPEPTPAKKKKEKKKVQGRKRELPRRPPKTRARTEKARYRPKSESINRDYISENHMDEKISQALFDG